MPNGESSGAGAQPCSSALPTPTGTPPGHRCWQRRPELSLLCISVQGPVLLSFPGLFRLVLAYFFSHGTIKSAEISRLLNQPNSPLFYPFPKPTHTLSNSVSNQVIIHAKSFINRLYLVLYVCVEIFDVMFLSCSRGRICFALLPSRLRGCSADLKAG